MNNNVLMGTFEKSWMNDKQIKYITFSVTDECNLRCTYCYFTHKCSHHRMTFDIAKQAIDNILSDERMLVHDGVVWDFIGGEPTLEMDLIDKICDYILISMYSRKHKWFYKYRFMIGTNGLLYASDSLQRFIKKHDVNVHVAITIDGNKEKHDMSRKKIDGSGSYNDVMRIIPLWIAQTHNNSTKSTFSSNDLPYLKDSIISLWQNGITNVMANVVFEDAWKEGDDLVFEEQLRLLADYVIDNKLWNKYSVRFFSQGLGFPRSDSSMKANMCGSGNMLAINYKGDYYPCVRFMESALDHYSGRKIGNINTGVDTNKVRAFYALSGNAISSDECMECPISNECNWCTGLNYDESLHKTIFERKTHLCKMHKANVRADLYFWNRYEKETGMISPRRYNQYHNQSSKQRYLYIICDDSTSSICHYDSCITENKKISIDTYNKAVQFCETNYFTPIFIGDGLNNKDFGFHINGLNAIKPSDEFWSNTVSVSEIINNNCNELCDYIYLTLCPSELDNLEKAVNILASHNNIKKIKIIFKNYIDISNSIIVKYRDALINISKLLLELWANRRFLQIDVITDAIYADKRNVCSAGKYSFTMSPSGDIYICPGFYYANNKSGCIGNIHSGVIADISSWLDEKKFSLCQNCDVKHCDRCLFQNISTTDEITVPSEEQCVLSNIEATISACFVKLIKEQNIPLPFNINYNLNAPKEIDPIIKMRGPNIVTKNLKESVNNYEKN